MAFEVWAWWWGFYSISSSHTVSHCKSLWIHLIITRWYWPCDPFAGRSLHPPQCTCFINFEMLTIVHILVKYRLSTVYTHYYTTTTTLLLHHYYITTTTSLLHHYHYYYREQLSLSEILFEIFKFYLRYHTTDTTLKK